MCVLWQLHNNGTCGEHEYICAYTHVFVMTFWTVLANVYNMWNFVQCDWSDMGNTSFQSGHLINAQMGWTFYIPSDFPFVMHGLSHVSLLTTVMKPEVWMPCVFVKRCVFVSVVFNVCTHCKWCCAYVSRLILLHKLRLETNMSEEGSKTQPWGEISFDQQSSSVCYLFQLINNGESTKVLN